MTQAALRRGRKLKIESKGVSSIMSLGILQSGDAGRRSFVNFLLAGTALCSVLAVSAGVTVSFRNLVPTEQVAGAQIADGSLVVPEMRTGGSSLKCLDPRPSPPSEAATGSVQILPAARQAVPAATSIQPPWLRGRPVRTLPRPEYPESAAPISDPIRVVPTALLQSPRGPEPTRCVTPVAVASFAPTRHRVAEEAARASRAPRQPPVTTEERPVPSADI